MTWTPRSYQKRMALVRDGAACRYCGRRVFPKHMLTKEQWLDVGLTFDHFIPRNDGGPTEVWNLFVSCYRDNSEKGHDDYGCGSKWRLLPAPAEPIAVARPNEEPRPMLEAMVGIFPKDKR